MKTKKAKLQSEGLLSRKRWQRLDETAKVKVVRDVTVGHMSYREASRKYSLLRNTIKKWVAAAISRLLKHTSPGYENPLNSEMKNEQADRLLQQQIRLLTKELERLKLKCDALETMIVVAEEDLKIKIRKKRGTKQSVECGEAIQR